MTAPAAGPLEASGAVELARVLRSGFVESRHLGVAVLVDADGAVQSSFGDADAAIYPRSALKAVQATAALGAGADLAGESLGLAVASHVGTPAHVAVVERMLASVGLDETVLGCPAHWPEDPASRSEATAPSRLTMNCSGKHAGFVVASMAAGWDVGGYLDPAHPMQRAVSDTVEALAGERVAHWGVDGCLAPTPALSLAGLARGLGRVAAGQAAGGSAIVEAVRASPWTVEGPGCPDTVLIEKTGFLVKRGADGVLAIAVPGSATVAVKVLDGARRPTHAVALSVLAGAGVITRERADELTALVGDPSVVSAI